MIGQTISVNNKSFIIKRLLGKGKSGYSYLIENDHEAFVLKQMHNEACSF